MRTPGRAGSVALGLICGAAAGALLGILIAPRSGAMTRRQLMKSGNRLKQRAVDTYESAVERVGVLADRGVEAFEQVSDRAEKTAGRARSAARRSA